MNTSAAVVLLHAALLLNACTLTPTHVAVLPTPTAMLPSPSISPMSSPTLPPSPYPTLTPAATATSVPTLDPQVVADTIATGQVVLQAQGIDPLCLRWQDTDGDGEAEWIGLHLRPTDRPRLEAFVLDGEAWYDLRALEKEEFGLGMYPTCELDIQDINDDGRVEILIQGHAEDNTDVLNIFFWNNAGYVLLASFQGDAGIEVENLDGALGKEIVVRHDAGKGLAWEAIHTWDGANYGWTWERYDWLHADHPHTYLTDSPEHVVISFYLALDSRDLPGAYNLLGSGTRASQPYQTWALGFDTTLAVEVGAVHQTTQTDNSASVTAQVRSYDNLDGYIVGRLWDTTWSVMQEGQHWRLESAKSDELDQWEAHYFP